MGNKKSRWNKENLKWGTGSLTTRSNGFYSETTTDTGEKSQKRMRQNLRELIAKEILFGALEFEAVERELGKCVPNQQTPPQPTDNQTASGSVLQRLLSKSDETHERRRLGES